MLLNNYQRNSFLINDETDDPAAIYILPNKYSLTLEVDIGTCVFRLIGYNGKKILLTGTNGVGKTKFITYLINDYKSQVYLENNDNEVAESLLVSYSEFYSMISYKEEDSLLMEGTILDNLFATEESSKEILGVLEKYPKLDAMIRELIINRRRITNETTPWKMKNAISLFRALWLAESRQILIFDGVEEEYLEEIFEVHKEKCIIIAGHYSEEAMSEFDHVYVMHRQLNV